MVLRFRFALVVIAHSILVGRASAQWQAGVKVGFGQSGYTGSREFNWNSGPSSAGFVSYAAIPQFSVQLEVSPNRKVGVSNIAGSTLTISSDYLSFPILAQLRLPNPSGVTPFLLAGPIFSIRLDCSLVFLGGGVETNDTCEGGGRPKTSPVTVGLGAGAGLERSFGMTSFIIEGRGSSGLTIERLPLDATRPRSFGWSLLGGVSLPLSRTSAPPGPIAPPMAASVPRATPAQSQLPELPTVAVASTAAIPPVSSQPFNALDRVTSTRRVSVNAVDADVRSLLLLIAKEGGLSIVVDPEVSGRVWLTLTDVPVIDALRAVVQSAHLNVTTANSGAAQAAVVFYQLPVNINTAPASVIANRFGVSDDMAKWVADNQPKKTVP